MASFLPEDDMKYQGIVSLEKEIISEEISFFFAVPLLLFMPVITLPITLPMTESGMPNDANSPSNKKPKMQLCKKRLYLLFGLAHIYFALTLTRGSLIPREHKGEDLHAG